VNACTIQTNGIANHTVAMEVDRTYTKEGILNHRVTSLESLRTIKDDQEEAG
jgi:hypothetical protein